VFSRGSARNSCCARQIRIVGAEAATSWANSATVRPDSSSFTTTAMLPIRGMCPPGRSASLDLWSCSSGRRPVSDASGRERIGAAASYATGHHSVDRRVSERLQSFRRRNSLQITHLYRAPLPGIQNLVNPRPAQSISGPYSRAAPSKNEVELNKFPLHIRPVVFWENRHLRREADPVPSNGTTQIVNPHFAQFCVLGNRAGGDLRKPSTPRERNMA